MAGAKDPRQEAVLRFDGSGKPGQAPVPAGPPPGSGRDNGAAGPPAQPSAPVQAPRKDGFLRRLVRAVEFQSKAERWLVHSLVLGLCAALAAPILYKAAPSHTLLFTGPIAIVLPVLVIATAMITRLIRFLGNPGSPGKPRGPPGRFLQAGLRGLLLGLALGAAPAAFKPHIIEAGASVVAPKAEVRRVQGHALEDELIRLLSRTAEGRNILDGLRDRGGTIRMPDFFVSEQASSVAAALALFDAIFIDKSEITSRGWRVEDFVKDPELQRRLAAEFQVSLSHEMRHSNQFRRSIFFPGQFLQNLNLESEYESAITEHLHVRDMLKADPHADISGDGLGIYLAGLEGFDALLRQVDSSYPKNEHVSSPYYDAYLKRRRAEWPRVQVEGYVLLAKRSLPQHPRAAILYLHKARLLAQKHGLAPPPDLGLPPSLPPLRWPLGR